VNVLATLFGDSRARVGAAILLFLLVVALLAPLLMPGDPVRQDFGIWLPLSPEHWLGTTALGQDVFKQLVWGTRLTLLVGLVTGLITTTIAVIVGLSSAYLGGRVADFLNGLTNVFLVMPGLPLILVFSAFVKIGGVLPIILVLSFTGWAWGARVLRSQALSIRERDFVQASIVSGEGPLRIIFADILPNMLGLIAAQFFGAALYAVLAEASLTFLGVGDVSVVSWGTMIYWAHSQQALMRDAWYYVAAPGLAIALLGMSFALLNFGLDTVTNPRLRQEVAPRLLAERKRVLRSRAPGKALLEVRNLVAGYISRRGKTVAVRDVDLDLKQGEFLGLAGESGCGKTTLAFAVARLLRPPGTIMGGEAVLDGTDMLALEGEALRQSRWRDMSIVFQASMNVLNPVIRVRDQVYDAMQAHGITDKAKLEERAVELFRMVGLRPEHLSVYPHQLSGGMKQRAVIAIALALEPKVVIMDEPTTALDVVVQRSLLQEIDVLRRRLNLSIIFITHDLSLLVEISDRVAIMYAGLIVEEAPSRALYAKPIHPYTQRLMRAFPPLEGPRERREGIAGRPPSLDGEFTGCPFYERCDQRLPGICDKAIPPLISQGDGHRVACHLYQPAPEASHVGSGTLPSPVA
jgi:peptide/nickel transport system permease protein